jgi:hypothetical protein
LWLITAGPGYWGYGSSLLWIGSASSAKRPLYELVVSPGNVTIRRKSDQVIAARLLGFATSRVTLHARYGATSSWQETPMTPKEESDRYQFMLPSVSDPVEYYVQAGHTESQHFRIAVKDSPAVQRIRTAIHFPGGLDLQDVVDDPGGDIRAVIGSKAQISVLTDRPLDHGVVQLDNGKRYPLERADGNWTRVTIPVEKDGSYHIADLDGNEAIRISEDYFIEAKKDEAPTVRLARPGHDPHVSPIEEVPITVEAVDDFGVKSLDLHYSVNGGPEQSLSFKNKPAKEVRGNTTLYLENFKLAPGDVVAMYATAADANATSRSDMIFAQAEPFDFKFSQSQQSGGMGGMGGGQNNGNISERQKEIIAATWNETRGQVNVGALKDRAKFLADTEGKLSEQAATLAHRMGNRELSGANSDFENFSKLMTTASAEMNEAVGMLSPAKWRDALAPEQKALQSLLRAEALFRDIQVAFGQSGGGQGGSGAQRDLARMFDLELDTTKNQYETGQSQSQSASKQQQAIDQAFERLKALARRQQELAQQKPAQQQPLDQRWQEEQLRREAEELRQQMKQLAQNGQGARSDSQLNQSGEADGQQNSGSQQAQGAQQRGASSRAMQRAANALEQAEEDMRRAVTNTDSGARERAAEELASAQRELAQSLRDKAGQSLSDLSRDAENVAQNQRDLAGRMRQMYGLGPQGRGDERSSSRENGEGMPEMNDPDNPKFGYDYRRRFLPRHLRPTRSASAQERALAGEKEALAGQLEELQRQVQQQTENLSASAPRTASKLRKALSEAEQKELALRMQKNAEWMREGYGEWNLGMEDSVTSGLDQLSRNLRDAEQSLKAEGGDNTNGTSQSTAEALNQVRKLREQLERARSESARGGQQSGGALQRGGQSQEGAQGPAFSRGDGSFDRRELQQSIDELKTFRGQISGRDRALANDLGGALGSLRDLNADPNVLRATISDDVLARLEKLEVELSRKLGEQASQSARTGVGEKAPEQYRDSVAEYFKKLSQPAPK